MLEQGYFERQSKVNGEFRLKFKELSDSIEQIAELVSLRIVTLCTQKVEFL